MKIAICDDDIKNVEYMQNMILRQYPLSNIVNFRDGKSLLRHIDKNTVDIVLLDIKLPEENGIDIAKRIRKKHKDLLIIFITSEKEYVFEAFDVKAFHYLLKPFTDEKFYEILKKAVAEFENGSQDKKNTIIISKNGIHRKVVINKIIYAEVFNRIVMIHGVSEDIEYYGKLSELESLVGDSFYRPHRSYLINMKYVEKYDSTHIKLYKGETPLAKAKYSDFVKQFSRYNS